MINFHWTKPLSSKPASAAGAKHVKLKSFLPQGVFQTNDYRIGAGSEPSS